MFVKVCNFLIGCIIFHDLYAYFLFKYEQSTVVCILVQIKPFFKILKKPSIVQKYESHGNFH